MAITLICETCHEPSVLEDSIIAFDLGWNLESKLKCPHCIELEQELIAIPAKITHQPEKANQRI